MDDEQKADESQSRNSKLTLKHHVHKMIRETKLRIVRVGYKVNWVREVDPRHATFRCDFKLFYYWKDEFFIGWMN